MEIYLGFDPGGKKRFGWAVCSLKSGTRRLRVLKTGTAGNAEEAITRSLSAIPKTSVLAGAGIDAPLFWSRCGGRNVDGLLRGAMKELGAPSPGGTVQHINALRGACTVQGVLAAYLLHERFPRISITESHPKVLLYLLGIANKRRKPASVTVADLSEYVDSGTGCISDDERDAILGAITAFAQREKRRGWRNLFEEENNPIIPLDYPVAYWMPWSLIGNCKTAQQVIDPTRYTERGRVVRWKDDLAIVEALEGKARLFSASKADRDVPTKPGFYSIFVDDVGFVPEPFAGHLRSRETNLLYIGKASISLV